MRRAAKVDGNHSDVVDALEAAGATVQSLAAVGRGCPDLLVGYLGRNWLFEVKDGSLSPSRRALTDDQIKWHGGWRGAVEVINGAEEALQLIGAA